MGIMHEASSIDRGRDNCRNRGKEMEANLCFFVVPF